MAYINLVRVVVTPLNKQLNSDTTYPTEYTVSFKRTRRFTYDDEKANLNLALENAAKLVSAGSGLTYSYRIGDKAIFDVRYRTQKRQTLQCYKFVTGLKI